MEVKILDNKNEMGIEAAQIGASLIKAAIKAKGEASVILATGVSQYEMLERLVKENIAWEKVTCFHLDEYIGLSETHEASFRKYLKERFAEKVEVKEFNFINGENDPLKECERLNSIISKHAIDVAFIGIGENGHLAFNDPPADFITEEQYIIVELDEDCRKQQLGEGWFPNLESVPRKAISMSVNQILKSESIICTVPDARKAEAVKKTINNEISPLVPASILRRHPKTFLLLDKNSASLIE